MSRRVQHLDTQRGFPESLCGKSLHGWQGPRTPESTTDPRKVTCKACLKKLGRG